jgi:uncharacterized protein with ParB-like and HNH nuclease domain
LKTTATNRKLRLLLTGIKNGTLLPRPEFQRRLVWSNKHKVAFLSTVLMELPFPEIYIAAGEVNSETGEGSEMLVDGQQRITTLYQYFIGSEELRLGRELVPYTELDEKQKRGFLEYEVVVRDLGLMSIEEIKQVFLRINSTNYAVNAMEVHNARYDGEFKTFGEEITRHSFFNEHNIFSATDIRRMHDLRLILVIMVTIMSTYFNRDDELEIYLEKFNDEFEYKDEVGKQLEGVFSFIRDCNFAPKSRAWKKADFFTLLVEIHRLLFKDKIDPNPEEIYKRLTAFYEKIDSIAQIENPPAYALAYYKASLQATNDRSSRIMRGQILREVMVGTAIEPPIG